jgi:hypothetical protein
MVVLLITYIVYDHFQEPPPPTVQLIPGDTTTVTINQEVFDSLKYFFEAKLDSVNKTKVKWKTSTTVHDTVTLTDTVYLTYWSMFALGDSTLGVKGKVTFDMEDFGFKEVVFNNQQKIKTVVDTMKITTQTPDKPFYFNEWFYATLSLFALLLSSL